MPCVVYPMYCVATFWYSRFFVSGSDDDNGDDCDDGCDEEDEGDWWAILLIVIGSVVVLVAVILLIIYQRQIRAACCPKSDDRPSTPSKKIVPMPQYGEVPANVWTTTEKISDGITDPPPYCYSPPPCYDDMAGDNKTLLSSRESQKVTEVEKKAKQLPDVVWKLLSQLNL